MRKRVVCTGIISGVVIVMGILLTGMFRWKLEWEPENNVETNKFLANNERGFYNMRGVMISDVRPVEEWVYESIRTEQSDETIELLQIHIGSYSGGDISAIGLEQIRRTFEAYAKREHQVSLIVRFLYDWEGNGAQSDPSSINIVLRHMEQLGEIVSEYEDQIYIVQGVLVGSWAEMHSSRYLTGDSYQTLIRKMDETMPDSVFLAGESCLSEYSMLNAPRTEVYACNKRQKEIHQRTEVFPMLDTGEYVELELWKYPPELFATDGKVDIISLYCSLKANPDERVEGELESLLEEIKW